MQTITQHTEDLGRQLAVRAQIALGDLSRAVAERSRQERGQTAAEYMGILMIVALIIVGLVGLDVDDMITGGVRRAIKDIKDAE